MFEGMNNFTVGVKFFKCRSQLHSLLCIVIQKLLDILILAY